MSTLVGGDPSVLISSEKDLSQYFHRFIKARENRLIGLEAEFFAVDAKTGKGVQYSATNGIEVILKALAKSFAYEPILENNHVIALKKGATMITLEPGGQIELSASPVLNAFEVEEQVIEFIGQWKQIQKQIPSVELISAGIQPFSSIEEIEQVPKVRYDFMGDYLGKRGKLAHWMMKLTGTNQISYDYTSEEDAMQSLRTVLLTTPIATALFAHSGFYHGQDQGYQSKRLEIWLNTDPERTGIHASFTEPGQTFQDYLKYVLQVPMMFIVRNGKWVSAEGINFSEFIKSGWKGFKANMNDFELHLSAAFPEARIKQYLEVRGCDAQVPSLIPAIGAFWKGLLYCESAQKEAIALMPKLTPAERALLLTDVAKKGLHAELKGKKLWDYATRLVDISCESLALQKVYPEEKSECLFLNRIREQILSKKMSPADQVLKVWQKNQASPEKLIQYLRVS